MFRGIDQDVMTRQYPSLEFGCLRGNSRLSCIGLQQLLALVDIFWPGDRVSKSMADEALGHASELRGGLDYCEQTGISRKGTELSYGLIVFLEFLPKSCLL